MSDEVKRVKKQIEVDVVELKVELSAQFFDNMEKAKKQVADKRGYDVTYGEYIEEAMNDLVKMVEDYSAKLIEASEIIKKQDKALGSPATAEEFEAMLAEKEEPEVEPEVEEAEVPENLYAHIEEDSAKEIMYG